MPEIDAIAQMRVKAALSEAGVGLKTRQERTLQVYAAQVASPQYRRGRFKIRPYLGVILANRVKMH